MNPQPGSTGEAPEGDAANLEYARKHTDLVLEKLADQLKRKKVDEGLLKDLGWTEAELRRFVERWQQRKAAAEQNQTKRAKRPSANWTMHCEAWVCIAASCSRVQSKKDTMRDLQEGYQRDRCRLNIKERLRAL